MKKLYTLFVLLLAIVTSNAQIVNIPDAAFKAKLLQASPTQSIAYNAVNTKIKIDTNDDGEIQVSEAVMVYSLSLVFTNIQDFTGIESFSNLVTLNCNNSLLLTSLNLSGLPNLKNAYFSFSSNLATINLSNLPILENFRCESDLISTLNLSGVPSLISLICNNNIITTLNVTGLTSLETLTAHYNNLSTINLSSLTSLKSLNLHSNQLTALDFSGLSNLQSISVDNNQIQNLEISGFPNLTTIGCANNPQLTTLNISNLPNLTTLYCGQCNLNSLNPNSFPNLQTLYCQDNQLTTLNINSTKISSLICTNNLLETLYVKNGYLIVTSLTGNSNLQYICTSEQYLANFQQQITNDGLTNCHVNTYCTFNPGGAFYTMQGNLIYDADSNGCDASDSYFYNLRVKFTGGGGTANVIPNGNGGYDYDVQAGTYTITPILENPSYYSVSPTSATVTFPASASPHIQDFCITQNGPHNDLEISIFPTNEAIPGFDATYTIVYKNKGTAVQSGSVNLIYNDDVLDLISSSPVFSSQTNNTLTWNFSSLQPLETREISIALNVNSPIEVPPVNIDDILSYTANVIGASDEIPNDNTSTLNQIVVSSYDPNDKTCVEGTTITPSMVAQYVHYIIRFENNGTANAQNIVVKDMIDTSKLNVSSLVPLSGSHPFVTRILNTNRVEFIFENINLPFDDANNDGYVAFKIKTNPGLVVGNTFSNSASIYFDYNFPIVTNTYTTTIQALGNQDFEFNSVFILSPVPVKDWLTITTKELVTITSINIYNTLGQLIQVNTNPNETIDVSGLQSGSYFIKIVSDKGATTGKFIKE